MVTKTPEQMAIEAIEKTAWRIKRKIDGSPKIPQGLQNTLQYQAYVKGFKTGYQAAKDEMNSLEKPDSCEHILDMAKMVDVNSSNNSNGWISVKDKNPLPKTMVLVCHNNFGVQMGYLDENSIKPCRNRWIVYVREHEEWTGNNIPKTGKYEYINISHWMPIPAPPKE